MTQLRCLLPFATASASSEVFPSNAEKAAVLCMAEIGRAKGGRFMKRGISEKIVFVTKVCYPFWLAPFRGLTYLLDGLNTSSYRMAYSSISNINDFKVNLNSRSSTTQVYINFLSNHLNFFQNNKDEQTLIIEGFTGDREFETDFMDFLKTATPNENPVIDGVLVSPVYDETAVTSMLKKVENTRSNLEKEIGELNEIVKFLDSKTKHFLAALREKIKQTQEKYKVPLQEAKEHAENKASEINKKYLNNVTEVSNRYGKEIIQLQKEILKIEKAKEQIDNQIEHTEKEIKAALVSNDETTEQNWKEKLNALKKELPEANSAIKEAKENIQEIEEKRKKELFQLKQENDEKIKECNKELFEVEAARGAEIATCKREMETIEELTAKIIQKINQLVKTREREVFEFDDLGIKQQTTSPMLAFFPFYLFCYQSKGNKRFTYIAPSIVSNFGFSTRLRALGKTRISKIFQPRSIKMVSILNSFISMLEENVVFSIDIYEACSKISLLANKDIWENLRTGLVELKTQGWLSEHEVESFYRAVSQFAKL